MSDVQSIEATKLDELLSSLVVDYSPLNARLRSVPEQISCDCDGVAIRINFPSFGQGRPTVEMFIDAVSLYLTRFALPRSQILAHKNTYGKISADDYDRKSEQLKQEALDLFKKAQKATNRNGEIGELVLYLLTEWLLGAPQILAKMPLKTNSEMPVYGSDGIHVRYDAASQNLIFYWGESKLHASATGAIDSAMESISTAMEHENIKYELELVERYIDLAGLDTDSKAAIIKFLDPFEEESNNRVDTITCLIAFQFSGYGSVAGSDNKTIESSFSELIVSRVKELAPKVAKSVKEAKLEGRKIEIFFLPVPSVKVFRDYFQNKIGWNS
ncbi:DUF1837 domain-containing protein [Limnobacter sp.]|uniref:HamA C-terminal domain-containing protein n=1 Tax=Pseudomonadota TaxID=1224 RepID=UPI0025B7FC19|nr:DUF1837 domain-containing protein [Limnobacter sp.]